MIDIKAAEQTLTVVWLIGIFYAAEEQSHIIYSSGVNDEIDIALSARNSHLSELRSKIAAAPSAVQNEFWNAYDFLVSRSETARKAWLEAQAELPLNNTREQQLALRSEVQSLAAEYHAVRIYNVELRK